MRFYIVSEVAGESVVSRYGYGTAHAAERQAELRFGAAFSIVKAWYSSEALCKYLYNKHRREARRHAREARAADQKWQAANLAARGRERN